MNRLEQDQMLKEILGGEELADLRQTTLVQGLAALRRRRQRRHVMTICTLASLPVLLVLVVLLSRALGPSQAHKTFANSAVGDVSAPNPRNPDVQIISDEQLFALFPGRPMALIGKPGHQELVFLDRSEK